VETKPTNAHKCTKIPHTVNKVSLLHVSATLVVILRGIHYKRHIIRVYEPMHRCKILFYMPFVFHFLRMAIRVAVTIKRHNMYII